MSSWSSGTAGPVAGARLLLADAPARRGVPLDHEVTIGSSPGCSLRLPGLRPLQAVVRAEDEEYVVIAVAGSTSVDGLPVLRRPLAAGSRIRLGAHTLVFRPGSGPPLPSGRGLRPGSRRSRARRSLRLLRPPTPPAAC